MRVLIINLIVNTAEKGRIPRYATNHDSMIYNMARGFVALGHEVTVVADDAYAPLKPENTTFETVYLPGMMRKMFRPDLLPLPRRLHSFLKENAGRFDLVLSSEVFSMGTLVAALVPEIKSKLMIWQELSLYQRFILEIPARLWYNVVFPIFIGRKTPVVARSEGARKFMSKFSRAVSDVIVDHGVNGEVLNGNRREAKKSFVVVSQLIQRKRIDRIILAFAKFVALPGFQDYELEIIGDGVEKQSLIDLCRQLGIAGSVNFHGRLTQHDWAPISAASVAMLVDTRRDLNMVSITESIVNGTPVLTNSVPETASYILRNTLGIVKDDWGADELAEMVARHDEFRQNCLSIRYTLTNVGAASKIISIFNSL